MDKILKELLVQEDELQFDYFNEQTAWDLGCLFVEKAKAGQLPVTIDISRFDHQLFHCAQPGTSADNDNWIRRKRNLVHRKQHSSFYFGQLLNSRNTTIEKAFYLPEEEYAPHGGCFPILIKNTGMIGTITVSGLPQEEDHKLVVETIREFLTNNK